MSIFKTPPMRAPFFEFEVTQPSQNPNLPGRSLAVEFLKITKEWGTWCAGVASALGYYSESLTDTASLDFPLIAAGGTQDLTVTVAGVKAADPQAVVSLGLPTGLNAGLVFHAWVSADDTVTVRATNCTAAGINPAAATFRVEVRRY